MSDPASCKLVLRVFKHRYVISNPKSRVQILPHYKSDGFSFFFLSSIQLIPVVIKDTTHYGFVGK